MKRSSTFSIFASMLAIQASMNNMNFDNQLIPPKLSFHGGGGHGNSGQRNSKKHIKARERTKRQKQARRKQR